VRKRPISEFSLSQKFYYFLVCARYGPFTFAFEGEGQIYLSAWAFLSFVSFHTSPLSEKFKDSTT